MEPLKSFSEFKQFLIDHPFPKYIGMLPESERKTYYDYISYALKSYRVEWGVPFDIVTKYAQNDYLSANNYEYPPAIAKELGSRLFDTSYILHYIEELLDEGYDVDSDNFYSLFYNLMVTPNEREEKEKYEEIFKKIYERTEQKDDYLRGYKGLDFNYYKKMVDMKVSFEEIHFRLIQSYAFESVPDDVYALYQYALSKGYTVSDLMKDIELLFREEMMDVLILLAQTDIHAVMNYFETENKQADTDLLQKKMDEQMVETMFFIVNELIEHNCCYNPLFEYLFFKVRNKMSDTVACLNFAMKNEFVDTISTYFLAFLLKEKDIDLETYEELFSRAVRREPLEFKDYTGDLLDDDICNFMTEENHPIDLSFVDKVNKIFEDKITQKKCYETIYSAIFRKIINVNREYATYYNGADLNIYKKLANDGFQLNKKQIITILLYCDELTEEEAEEYFNQLNVKPFNQRAFREFSGDRFKLIESFNIVDDFLVQLGIERDAFIQYLFGNSYNWLDSILSIYSSSKLEEFKRFNNFFLENYYDVKEKTGITSIKYLIEILGLYTDYPELCLEITNSGLTETDKNRIKQLLNSKEIIKDRNIRTKEELANIDQIIFNNNKDIMIGALNSDDISKVKNSLCLLLFGFSSKKVSDYLNRYGNTKDFIQLKFNNRNNKEIVDKISEIQVFVSMMDDMDNCNDINVLKRIMVKTFKDEDTYFMCRQCNLMFQGFEEKVNKLYAEELCSNITDLRNLPDSLIDKELTEKYGIRVLDLSHSKYCMVEHQVGKRENAINVIKGISSGEQNTISCIVGTNRNQRTYGRSDGIVLATDCYSTKSFIKSSITNLFSNDHYRKYTIEFNSPFITQKQRGALELSSRSDSNNPEILSYREGLKFNYLVLFGDKEPTEDELALAKENNLTFVKVQSQNNAIDNPKEIYESELNEENFMRPTDNIILNFLENNLKKKEEKQPRKIAILTDVHGLFEPTLAVLEDIRKQGITEVYSLGDNIGTGPNPKEVMDLLEVYNVKSLSGNHEKYVSYGVDSQKSHFDTMEEYDEARRNSDWTRSKLTSEQIEKLKTLPEEEIINIGNQKVILTHYYGDYQTEEIKEVPDDVSVVIQGHIHRPQVDGNVITVKAAGFLNQDNIANYVVLTETQDGFEMEEKSVEFDKESTFHDIIESSMNKENKEKVESWLGGVKK